MRGAVLVGLLGACSSSDLDGAFAGGTKPLELSTAPGGLCGGDAAPKTGAEGSDDGSPVPGPSSPSAPSGQPSQNPSVGGGGSAYPGSNAAGTGPIIVEPDDPGESSAGGGGTVDDPEVGGAGGEPGAADAAPAARSAPGPSPQSLSGACAGLNRNVASTLYLSADDSSSMASPALVRHLIRSNQHVPARVVRAYEFLNYYDFSFEPAEPGQVRMVPQLSSCPNRGQLSFQVALQSEARDPSDRPPLNLTLVLDTSGSMAGRPLELQQAAVRSIAGQLRADDVVSVVTWNTAQRDLLTAHDVVATPDPELLAVADVLTASGGTDLDGGLRRGYELAEQQVRSDRINRVLVISDGIANVGNTNAQMIASHANDEENGAGIYLAGVGVGDGVNDTLLNVVTDAGRGAYIYLDSEQEAEKMLGERFQQVVDIAARAVRLEVTLPWYFQVEKFFGEAISTDPSKVRPQHLGPNDAMLFFQIISACDGTLIHGDDRIRLRATWQTPFTLEARDEVIDATLNDLAGNDAALLKAAAVAGYAEALVLADLQPQQRRQVLDSALDTVNVALDSLASADQDPDLLEVKSLLEQYRGP